MSKLSSVLDLVLDSDRYSGNTEEVIVAVFGEDQEVTTALSFLSETNEALFVISGSEALDYPPDIVVCVSNMTRRHIQIVHKLTKDLVDVVIVEESLSSNLEQGNTSKIHNNEYKNFTYLDNTSPHIIIYSNHNDIIQGVLNPDAIIETAPDDIFVPFSISGSEIKDMFEDYVGRAIFTDIENYLYQNSFTRLKTMRKINYKKYNDVNYGDALYINNKLLPKWKRKVYGIIKSL